MTIVRKHTWANVAPGLKVLIGQINAEYPQRKSTSAGIDAEGIWPSPAHTAASPTSDHEGGNAWDCDDDLSGYNGVPPEITPEMARRMSMHPANNYVLHDSGIYRDGVCYSYRGSNPHTGHAHVSIIESRRNNTSPWDIGKEPVVKTYKVIGIETPMTGATAKDLEFEREVNALGVKYGKQVREARTSKPLPARFLEWFRTDNR